MHTRFASADYQHSPSAAHWAALAEPLQALEAMANGQAQPLISVSPIDPGVGKTTAVADFTRVLLDSPEHEHVSMLIGMQRKCQITDLINKISRLEDEDTFVGGHGFAVLTADPEMNALGNTSPEDARVLFTTHKMIENRCRIYGQRFREVPEFHYLGRPREVRVWDEGILPGESLVVDRDTILSLVGPLRRSYPKLATDLDDLAAALRDVPHGEPFTLPDIPEIYGENLLPAIREVLRGRSQDLVKGATVLWSLFGRIVTVRQDGGYRGHTVLDYTTTLPEDIAPMVVMDASARVRETYRQWAARPDDDFPFKSRVQMLSAAAKDYRQVECLVWPRGGGKSSHKDPNDAHKIAMACAATINQKPGEEFLIVYHLPQSVGGNDFKELVLGILPPEEHGRLRWLTWGAHDATNEFKNVKNVFLAGLLYLSSSDYEALYRLSKDFPSSSGKADQESVKAVATGELTHGILQAACRGHLRKCVGEEGLAGECTIYVVAWGRHVTTMLKEAFPGASVRMWFPPVDVTLKGHVKRTIEYLEEAFKTREVVTFKAVRAALGIKDASSFAKDVRRHVKFCWALERMGIKEDGRKFVLVDEPWDF